MDNIWQFVGFIVGIGCIAVVGWMVWKALNPKPPYRK
jgi:hypothetical protein